jgi:hypothetical protein
MSQSKKSKEILFSELPLELKKQFLHHLAKNKVEFEKFKDSKYLQAKVKIIEEEEGKPKLFIPGKTKQRDFNKSEERKNKFHQDCVYSPWEQKKIQNNAKLDNALK